MVQLFADEEPQYPTHCAELTLDRLKANDRKGGSAQSIEHYTSRVLAPLLHTFMLEKGVLAAVRDRIDR